jgi:hypothetical protein
MQPMIFIVARVLARVETKMHFSIFAKMQKSCENGTIFVKFRENVTKILRKYSQKRKIH